MKTFIKMFKNKSYREILKKHIRSYQTVLGIETSCDDTAVGVVSTNREILAESKYNQWILHKKIGSAKSSKKTFTWPGGVIPNLAKQLHYENLIHAVSDCIEKMENGWKDIDAISLTVKPGLEPCLWEGVKFTKLLLNKYRLPFIPIHHMEAHALTSRLFDKDIKYPFLTLLISGGNCLLALVESYEKFYKLGDTLDISPGNCIDKISRHLGLYERSKYDCNSGGALMEKYAQNGDPNSYLTQINMSRNYCFKNKDCNFSFSGILTNILRQIDRLIESDYQYLLIDGIERKFLTDKTTSNVCASVQHVITIQLEDRLKRALNYLNLRGIKIEHVVLSGGVASNIYIRNYLEKLINSFELKLSSPPVNYCTDNGVMIAWSGCEKLIHNSNDIVLADKQNEQFYDNLKPNARCDFGIDLTETIKLLNLKNKKN